MADDGPASVRERPCTKAGVDNSGIRRQFDADFEPDGGLDVCELSLKRSTSVSITANDQQTSVSC